MAFIISCDTEKGLGLVLSCYNSGKRYAIRRKGKVRRMHGSKGEGRVGGKEGGRKGRKEDRWEEREKGRDR